MLLLLPILTFVVTFLTILGIQEKGEKPLSVRLSFLQAALVMGAFVTLSSELLSLLELLTTAGVAAAWSLALIVVMGICWRMNALHPGWKMVWRSIKSVGKTEVVFLAGLSIILLALLVIALRSPVNNTDSLQYHMSRVAHWEQNKSLRHYPAAYQPQLYNSIWPELMIFQVRLLWGNHQLANLVQWLCMIGSLIGVTAVAGMLGISRKGQIAATAFAASVPIGVLQATSTQTDWVSAFWLIVLTCFVVRVWKYGLSTYNAVYIGLALGLGLLSKGTFYPYAVPGGIWVFVSLLRRFNRRKILSSVLIVTGLTIMLNFGYWARNMITFGTPLGSKEWILSMTAREGSLSRTVSAVTRNIMMNFTTPYDSWNEGMGEWLRSTFLGVDPELEEFYFIWGWNHEDLAGNPVHFFLIPVSLLLILLFRNRFAERTTLWGYILFSSSMFLFLSGIVHMDLYGNRYQLPFLIVWAPVFGAAVSLVRLRFASAAITFLLLITALPWVLFNRTRPLIAMRNNEDPLTIPCDWHFGCTSTGSVLLEQPSVLVFANWMQYRDPYLSAADYVLSSGCKDVGLRIDSHDLEYLFWWMLDTPDSGIRIESLYYAEELEKYADPGFQPCIILCTICAEREKLHNLDRVASSGEIQVYGGSNFHPLADSE